MQTKTRLLPLVFLLLNLFTLNAQKLTFDDVTEVRLEDMGPVFQNNQVKGYFAFYYIDKAAEKKKSNYKLVLLDENLNKIAEKKLVESDDFSLSMASYNGKNLFMVFHNANKSLLEFRQYDLKLNQLSVETRELEYAESYFISYPYSGIQQVPPQIVSLDEKGFLFYNFDGQGGVKYKIQYFPTNGAKAWKRETGEKDRKGLLPSVLCQSDKILLHNFTEWSTPSKYLQGINLETGRIAFDKEMTVENRSIQVFHAYPDTAGNFVVVGQYYEKTDNILSSESLGLFVGKIDAKGVFMSHKFISWANDVTKKVAIDEKGMIEGKGHLFLRDAAHTKDGRLYLVGELYEHMKPTLRKKRAIRVKDFVVLEIAPDWTLQDFKFFDKAEHDYEFVGIPLSHNLEKLANNARMNGGFDYQYFLQTEQQDAFTFFYLIRETINQVYTKKLGTLSMHVGDSKFETDAVSLDSKATMHRVMPAKAGHLLIIDYYRKTKTLDMRIEKFNY